MTARRIEAVLFDLGETLLTFGRLNLSALSAESVRRSYDYLTACGRPVGSFWAYRLMHVWGIRLQVLKSSLTGNDFDSLALLKQYGRRKGFDLTEAQWEELNWKWYEPLAEKAVVEADTAASLHRLRQMGLKVGLLSNTFIHKSSLERHMADAGFLEALSPRLYTYQYPWRKPDARIFRAAAAAVGVPCEHIAYVGDRIDNDVEGAAAVGMWPILKTAYTNAGRTPPPGVPVIDAIAELPDLFGRLCDIKKKAAPPPSERVGMK